MRFLILNFSKSVIARKWKLLWVNKSYLLWMWFIFISQMSLDPESYLRELSHRPSFYFEIILNLIKTSRLAQRIHRSIFWTSDFATIVSIRGNFIFWNLWYLSPTSWGALTCCFSSVILLHTPWIYLLSKIFQIISLLPLWSCD